MIYKGIVPVIENTYHKAFIINAFTAGAAAAILVEYHRRDPFNLYRTEKKSTDIAFNVFITLIIAVIITYISFWICLIVFGFGDSLLVK
jgi:hypothetical protein